MSNRPQMLASTIRGIIAPILKECPRACGIVSITTIDVSRDLSYATVYISALKEPAAAMKFLESRRNDLQRSLGSLDVHRTPMLRFRIDASIREADRIDTLLRKAAEDAA